jgi:hypothetical protein
MYKHGDGADADCRERILEAAGEIFAECGFRGATVVIGQCLYYYNARSIITRLYHQDVSNPDQIEWIADHIMDFSLGGLEHYANHNEDGMEKEGESQIRN